MATPFCFFCASLRTSVLKTICRGFTNQAEETSTHFGYEKVSESEKTKRGIRSRYNTVHLEKFPSDDSSAILQLSSDKACTNGL